jgi:mRNA-degrading endonuclease YafQ of YafQ-DinJ toxin-antitoxin module
MPLEIFYSTGFKRAVKKLPKSLRVILVEKGRQFEIDPFHPTLRTHKLADSLRGLWSFSLDYHHRVIFEFIGKQKVLLHSVGDHSIYRKRS